MTPGGKSLDRGPGPGLAARLLLALALVLLSGGGTAWLVASVVGPSVFHEHMIRAGLQEHDAAVLHAEDAFRSASTVALSLATLAAAVASLGVSLVLTKRIGRSLSAVAAAAARVGSGEYGARVPAPGLGREFDQLTSAFNHMATRLHDAERLRGRLLADVAHEVRTPVATIQGYLEAVEDGVQPMDAATIAVLRDQAARLTHLAEDLAAVTRAEAGDLRLDRAPVPVARLLEAAAAAGQERAAAAGVHLAADGAPAEAVVEVDPRRMGQVLDNLVSNAIRHTPRGGRVDLRAVVTGERVHITVTDTGEGIEASHLRHVFERFYRADTARDRARGGSGIGLAIVKALTEAHGGTVGAESAGPGRGSTFTVDLPAVSPAPSSRR